jgi:hypothetical protein
MSKEYKKAAKIIREQLDEIVNPAVMGNHSYETLEDIVTNVILLSINFGKKDWEKLPKREVRTFDTETTREKIIKKASTEDLINELTSRMEEGVFYLDTQEYDKKLRSRLALYCALKDYIFDEWEV